MWSCTCIALSVCGFNETVADPKVSMTILVCYQCNGFHGTLLSSDIVTLIDKT